MRELGFPKKLIRLIAAMCLKGNCGKAMVQGRISREFEINSVLRQGFKVPDVPTLFNTVLQGVMRRLSIKKALYGYPGGRRLRSWPRMRDMERVIQKYGKP